ncbi:MAG: hypothetical protein IJ523_05485 [Succinivibrionaceae bacterium]|nr:hypothetical protein [Succinivibrionaceae bacterium]
MTEPLENRKKFKTMKLAALSAACMLALSACGGHSHHSSSANTQDEPADTTCDVLLNDGVCIKVENLDYSVSFKKTVYNARPMLEKLKSGKGMESMDLDEKEIHNDLFWGIKSVAATSETNDSSATADSQTLANIHSVFHGNMSYKLSASKNDEKTDESAYRLVLKALDTDVDGAVATPAIFSEQQEDRLANKGYLGMTRSAMVKNEKVALKAEICVASNDEDGKILETADGKEACQEKTFTIESNAYGMYKIAMADHLTCGLNRIGDVYCWGTAPGMGGISPYPDVGAGTGDLGTAEVSGNCTFQIVDGILTPVCTGMPAAQKQILSAPTIFAGGDLTPEVSDLVLTTASGNPEKPVLALHVNGDLLEYPLMLMPVAQGEEGTMNYAFTPVITSGTISGTFFAETNESEIVNGEVLYNPTYIPNVRSFAYSPDAALIIKKDADNDENKLLMVAKGPAQIGYEGYISDDLSVSKLTIESAKVYTGGAYSCVYNEDKTKLHAGDINCFGTLGYEGDDDSYISTTETGDGLIHSISITDSAAYSNIGLENSAYDEIPDEESHGTFPLKISVSDLFACEVHSNRAAYCWGLNVLPGDDNGEGQAGLLGIGSANAQKVFETPQRLEKFKDTRVYDIAVSHDHACAVATNDHKLFCWGSKVSTPIFGGEDENAPVYDKLGLGGSADFAGEPTEVEGLKDIDSVFVGKFRTCAIDNEGKAFCFGLNENGELGTGDTSSAVKPVEVKYEPIKYVKCVVAGDQERYDPEASQQAANWAGIEVCATSDDEDLEAVR